MNVVTIAGQLGRDIELRYTPAGKAVGTFSVADSQGKDKPTIWWRCQIWDKRAEALAPYLLKGQSVTVSGTLTEREYQDKDGTQKKAQEVRVSDVALMGGKPDAAQKPAAKPAPAKAAPAGSGFDDMDDDIPF
jgi:single-strand DNA-binding protein